LFFLFLRFGAVTLFLAKKQKGRNLGPQTFFRVTCVFYTLLYTSMQLLILIYTITYYSLREPENRSSQTHTRHILLSPTQDLLEPCSPFTSVWGTIVFRNFYRHQSISADYVLFQIRAVAHVIQNLAALFKNPGIGRVFLYGFYNARYTIVLDQLLPYCPI